jgi:23S rRNA-/tRNA-specific pseudouridylate synthase
LDILKAGLGWAVLNKPAQLVVHATNNPNEVNLLDLFEKHLKTNPNWAEEHGWNGQAEPSVAHRLDRGVSGAVLVVFDKRILPILHKQFEDRRTDKTYHAWVRGGPKQDADTWAWRLTKKAEGRSKPAGFKRYQVPAKTEMTVLKRGETYSKCALKLITGRKHQLRRHCSLAGCSIVGDTRYGCDEDEGMPRILLHAHTFSFWDPWNEEQRIDVVAPEPEDFCLPCDQNGIS